MPLRNDVRRVPLQVRVTQEGREVLERIAEELGVKPSKLYRTILEAALADMGVKIEL